MAHPGQTMMLDGVELIVGDDLRWYPNTSLAGQAAQGVMVDAPVGLLSLAQGAMNLGNPYQGLPGGKPMNFMPGVQRGYEGLARNLGVNVTPPQTGPQRFARAFSQVPGQAAVGAATGGGGLLPNLAGATAGTAAGQTIQELGGGGAEQFGGSLAVDVGVTALTKNPSWVVKLSRDAAFHLRHPRMVKALKMLDPLEIADAGVVKLMDEVNTAHTAAKGKMDAAYGRIVPTRSFQVSTGRLETALQQMIDEAGSVNSNLINKHIAARLEEEITKGGGAISFNQLRALAKEVNVEIAVNPALVATAGAKEQIGQLRKFVIPAIQQTFDDMVRAGQSSALRSPTGKAKSAVEALRKANAEATEYFKHYDKRSDLVKQLVDGVSGGQALDPQKAMRKVFSHPQQAVENARNIMLIVGRNPRNVAMLRRSFVEAVIAPDLLSFSARKARTDTVAMRAAGIEILGQKGYDHFLKMLTEIAEREPLVHKSGGKVGRVLGSVAGAATKVGSPWVGGLIGASVEDAAGRGVTYVRNHFGETAAERLVIESLYDPTIHNLLRTKVRNFSQPQLAQFERAARGALIRSGVRSESQPRTPMLPSELNPPPLTEQDLQRVRRPQ